MKEITRTVCWMDYDKNWYENGQLEYEKNYKSNVLISKKFGMKVNEIKCE